jgi:hypothetical protein
MLSESAIQDLRTDVLNELKSAEKLLGKKDASIGFVKDCLIPNKARLESELELLNKILEIE